MIKMRRMKNLFRSVALVAVVFLGVQHVNAQQKIVISMLMKFFS